MGKTVFSDERSFLTAWESGMPLIDPARAKGEGMFFDASEAVGRAVAEQGFRLFRNGGLPLIERRVDALRQEIILYPGPGSVPGAYEPVAVKVHVSHEEIQSVRERYWVGGTRPPRSIASGYLGMVESPPSWVLWDVADSWRTADELADWVSHLSASWFEHFESLDALAGDVLLSKVPLVTTADVLEVLLAEKGRERAKRYLREVIEFGATLSPRTEPLKRVDERHPVFARLDAIATSYRLR